MPKNNLTKEVKELYIDTYSTLKKKLEDSIRIWNDIIYSWIGRTNTGKIAMFSKLLFRLNAI